MPIGHNLRMSLFPVRLKAARETQRLTQGELAKRAGITQGSVSRLEKGDKAPSTELLQTLAKVLGVSVSHLLGDPVAEQNKPPGYGGKTATLSDYNTPPGLRDLVSDAGTITALKITDDELASLAGVQLPGTTDKDGYVQLLLTIRAVSKKPGGVTES